MIDTRIIIFCKIVSVPPIRTITVLIVPGPVRSGRLIGKTQMSSRSSEREISSSVILPFETLACIISKAMLKSRIPPATRSESTLMLNRLSMIFPAIAKNRAITHASMTDFFAISFLSLSIILLVKEMKVTTALIGLTTTKIIVKTWIKNPRFSAITYFSCPFSLSYIHIIFFCYTISGCIPQVIEQEL